MRLFTCAALIALSTGAVARADIQFYEKNVPGDVDNVLFNDTSANTSDIIGPATTVRGHIGSTPTADCASGSVCVDVKSNELLQVNNATTGGGGQATISANDGEFTTADVFLTDPPGGVYTKIVFALTGAGTGQDGQVTFTITVTEGDGPPATETSATFTTTPGNDFYTVVAINGQDIRNVNITAEGGDTLGTLRQLRLGFTDNSNPPQGVPEPASVVLLSSLIGGVALLRKRFVAAA
jgi:hypothetical protein